VSRSPLIKICGITDAKALAAAIAAGADLVGFVFFRRSPRLIAVDKAAELVDHVPRGIKAVGLFVDPTDAELEKVLSRVRLDMVQLHGAETPTRVDAIRKEFAVPAMKALGVASLPDVMAAGAYVGHADWLMFDAKPPANATRPGGNAVAFDWSLMRAYHAKTPWMLAGGLTAGNVRAAIASSGAAMVDVSSGVETRPGVKSPAKIRAFIKAARTAQA
jgi:phosphoribosylanthranilate isomerase